MGYNLYSNMFETNHESRTGEFIDSNGNSWKLGDVSYSMERYSYEELVTMSIKGILYSPSKDSVKIKDKDEADAIIFPGIERVKFNGPATVVFWKDGTKTVVKRTEEDKDDPRVAILYAIGKKLFGTNSKLKRVLDSYIPEDREHEMMAVLEEEKPKKGKAKK